jgi:ABC-type branched-subunit amino acid transport system substrate-binding protein
MIKRLCFVVLFACICTINFAQSKVKVAVFAPLYIDSAFNGYSYKLGMNNLPKYMLPGLEFYNGVQMAIDSLQKDGKELDVLIYDSKGKLGVENICNGFSFNNVQLIIAQFNSRQDVKQLADIAAYKQIPLISATYPNDGGVNSNPYFVLVNTSLKTHIEQLYGYAQKNVAASNILYVTKKGLLETMVTGYYNQSQRNATKPLKYKTIELENDFTPDLLTLYLDSTKSNSIIVGSLDEKFAQQIINVLAANKMYKTTLLGMPTWDVLKDFEKPVNKGITAIYTTTYNYSKNNSKLYDALSKQYRTKFAAKPSDNFFKGYESMYHFTHVLLSNPNNFLQQLSSTEHKVFNDFDIVALPNKNVDGTEYYENKKVYFVKKVDGVQVKP